jgi:hypothetical protein
MPEFIPNPEQGTRENPGLQKIFLVTKTRKYLTVEKVKSLVERWTELFRPKKSEISSSSGTLTRI